jgi:hypothetical protein
MRAAPVHVIDRQSAGLGDASGRAGSYAGFEKKAARMCTIQLIKCAFGMQH